jgi:protein-histidine pros-kinase
VSAELFDARTFGSAEEAIEFLGSVLESSTEYTMVATDPDGAILLWNEGARRLYGYESEDIAGRSWTVLHTDEDVQRGLPQEMADRALREGKWEGTVERVRKDGSSFMARVVTTPRRAAGRLAGFLLISSDISEQVRLSELRDANVQLEAEAQAKDRFLASMSHELRTPLNAILGFTGMLLMELPGPLNHDQANQLRTVEQSGKHLLSLINDLLDLARIESGKLELHVEPIEGLALLEEVAAVMKPLADEKGLDLEIVAPEGGAQLLSDRRALRQILINLSNNAIKFTDEGQVRLELTRRADGGDPLVRFNVVDTGRGIAADDQERLFAAFEQVGSGSARPYEGTGLGLYICQSLAPLLGATITFESEPGRGTTFTLELGE